MSTRKRGATVREYTGEYRCVSSLKMALERPGLAVYTLRYYFSTVSESATQNMHQQSAVLAVLELSGFQTAEEARPCAEARG